MRAAVLPVLAILAAATAAPATAQAPVPTPAPAPTVTPVPAPEPTIAAGIGAAGVDLSNQTITQAQATLQAAYGRAARAPVVVSVAGRRFTLRARRVRLRFDPNRTA